MINSYSKGDKLTSDDFISDWYFPSLKWSWAEVEEVTPDTVTLLYHPIDPDSIDEEKQVTRADMEHMLGWDLTPETVTVEPDEGQE